MATITFGNTCVMNFANALRGMRNPLMSHSQSDTTDGYHWHLYPNTDAGRGSFIPYIGARDYALAKRLVGADSPHRKFLRQIFVSTDIIAPAFWWTEADTYHIGCTRDSSSTMHTITKRPLTSADFDEPETLDERIMLGDSITALNHFRQQYLTLKENGENEEAECYFRALKRNLPMSFLYTSTWTTNYDTLANIYAQRRCHRLPHWRSFCEDFVERLPYCEFITNRDWKDDETD